MMMKRTLVRLCTVVGALALGACGMHTNPAAQTPQSSPQLMKPMDIVGGPTSLKLNVLLGDAAPNFGGRRLQRLDLGIKEIDAIENGQTIVLASFDEPHVVDVLAHQDDDGESLTNADVARSDYQQLRLVVDLASSTAKFTGGSAAPIDFLVNVASQSSVGAGSTTVTSTDGPGDVDVIVTQPFSISSDHRQSVRVDFNAYESMAIDATGDFLARPALFVAPIDDMGSVKGSVINGSGSAVENATVVAVASDGSIGNTGFTDGSGRFRIGTLRSGTYQLLVYNTYTTAAGWAMNASGQTIGSPNVITGPTITIAGGKTTVAGSVAD
jgi:hypothetical protein